MGHTHALSGAATGAAVGEFALHLHPAATATLAGLTACYATFNDLDQVGSCASRSLGFASKAVAVVIRRLSGGHRHLTHSALGVGIFTGLAWLVCHFRGNPYGRAGLAAFLALGIAAGLDAARCHALHRLARWLLPRKLRALATGGHLTDAAGMCLAAGMAWFGWGLALVPLAVAAGTSAHIVGDCLTVEGCPVASPLTAHHFGLPRPLSFTTGTWRESGVAVVLVLALGWLALRAADVPLPHFWR